MNKIARFEKISVERLKQDTSDITGFVVTPEAAQYTHDNIKLPTRATQGSAGYDFYTPIPIQLDAGKTIKIPTGIRCDMNNEYVLLLLPKSGLATKNGLRFLNTVPVIDSDYYYADNEGHIILVMTTDKSIHFNAGDKICQGIFVQYGITVNDDADGIRHGGFGSTGR